MCPYKEMIVRIPELSDVIKFVEMAIRVTDGDVDLTRGKYTVDAKSFMGVMSIDLSQDCEVRFPAYAEDFEKYLEQFKSTNDKKGA